MTKISIVHQHADWLLCYKPAGLDFHDEQGSPGFISNLKRQLNAPIWPVHRLDKPTSGLILVARSAIACAQLCALFEQRKIEKWYLAISSKQMKKKQGAIIGDMGKARRGAFKLLPSRDNPAITQFFSSGIGQGWRLCLLKPKSGKTHQLRVALKSLGAPIKGDQLYGGHKADRLYLHAYGLQFEYNGELFVFTEPPKEGEWLNLDECLKEWSKPWNLKWPKL